ncbi:MAG: extracellular solute-binding protein [Geminicoccaceae bacterium]|nr:extracellular solute-binding protein [Geminicoccaceae bacterium]MCS7266676.1 extracellular solute-binding protein [Geminicoccaceae bacterium]MCX7630124.1 extracellular solute-binding protein [Geminicoccaceae bacterium]MDW8123309.1 extracellular solute-binding protein [Geminicoccaceae bacterium]MDW8340390.1 extracellular solute-binding protein [Geminicoccaceae bacterium]
MTKWRWSRRTLLSGASAAAVAAGLGLRPRTARGAGKLSVGFWDHWVPGANDTLTRLCRAWAEKEKVDLTIDYIPSQGNKLLLTIAAEAQARSGHDVLAMFTWLPGSHAERLEPVDDVMKEVLARNGPTNPVVEYLGKPDGHWRAVPATPGSQMKGPATRFDLLKEHAGIDILAMYPPDGPADQEKAKAWTWDALLAAAEKCHKAGYPFGIGLGTTSDSTDTWGSLFHAFGARLVDEKGNIVVRSDATRAALDFAKRLAAFLPADAIAWDDGSNNRWLISGKGALIFNPPSAWAVAKRDAPQVAEKVWHHPAPLGPKGRFGPYLPYYWAIWRFSPNKSAAKSLLLHLSTREAAEQLVAASQGYDIPGYVAFNDFKTWLEEGPPKGTLRHYPPGPDQILSIAAAPAPHKIAEQIYNQATITKMIARIVQGGDTIEKAIAWAESELEGFMRG